MFASPQKTSLGIPLEYVKCDLCGKDDTEIIARPQGKLSNDLYTIVRCKKDGLVYTNPRVPKQYSNLLYDEAYCKKRDLIDPEHKRPAVMQHLLRQLEKFAKSLGSPRPKSLLDVGCGIGDLLQGARELGYNNVLGIDISTKSCEIAGSKGFRTYCGEVTDEALLPLRGTFDLVCSIAVVEHFHQPRRNFQAIVQMLKPGGLFYLATPDAGSPRFNNWLAERHIYYFTLNSLKQYFDKIGLVLLDPLEWPIIPPRPVNSPSDLAINAARFFFLHWRFLRTHLWLQYKGKLTNTALRIVGWKPPAQG